MQSHLGRAKRAGLGVALAIVLTSASAGAQTAVVYKWLDEHGVAHFTTQRDRVPGEYEDQVVEIRRGQPGSQPAVAATPPREPTPPEEAASTPPPVVSAPPPDRDAGVRVTPSGEFEEPPLGARPAAEETPSPRDGAAAITPPAGDEAPLGTPLVRETTPAPAQAVAVPSAPGADRDVATPPAREPAPDVAAPPPDMPGLRRPPQPTRSLAAAPEVTVPAAPVDPAQLEQHIAELEAQLDRDQAEIQRILSEPRSEGGTPLAQREDFRTLAQRLPELQAHLRALRAQRGQTASE